MSAIVAFNDLNLEILEYQDTWSLSNKQVAEGFGVSEEAIRQQKARNEFKEIVHFYTVTNCNGGADKTFWTKKGVITLGFKLRETPQTIAFRDWASDYILNSSNRPMDIQNVLADPRVFTQLALRYADEQDKNKQLEQAKAKFEKLASNYVALCDEIDELQKENAELKSKLSLKEQK